MVWINISLRTEQCSDRSGVDSMSHRIAVTVGSYRTVKRTVTQTKQTLRQVTVAPTQVRSGRCGMESTTGALFSCTASSA